MTSLQLLHGPLEFLFTIDEETGLTGANGLAPGVLTSRTLLNLDSEEEGALYVGCSGGRDSSGTWELVQDPLPAGMVGFEIRVRGLKGGHSGLEIDKGRGNAIKIANRVVSRLASIGGRLSRIDGGNKRNAIPRETDALVFVPKARAAEAVAIVEETNATAKAELATVEPDLAVTAEKLKGARGKVLKKGLQKKLLQTISALPHGVKIGRAHV